MGWPDTPDSQYLWREGGEPARQQYAAIAKAISQFEPLTMFVDPPVQTLFGIPSTSICTA